jgi:hypothetical protein
MDQGNDILNSKDLLKRAYNCKKDEFEYLLQKIDGELEKDRKNQDVLTAKLVITSKMAVKNINSK